jgi:hypothetical protein
MIKVCFPKNARRKWPETREKVGKSAANSHFSSVFGRFPGNVSMNPAFFP